METLESTGTTILSGEELEKRTRNELKIGNLHQVMWFYQSTGIETVKEFL
jgi:hypothetical protein